MGGAAARVQQQQLASLARAVAGVAAALQAADEPHSVLVGAGGRTVLLAPRQPQATLQALQQGAEGAPAVARGVNLAVAEACGLAVALTPEAYEALTEAAYDALLRAAALPPARFEEIAALAARAVRG